MKPVSFAAKRAIKGKIALRTRALLITRRSRREPQGPVDITSMLLGRPSSYLEEEALLYIFVLADVRKPSSNNAYTPLQALINSIAVFNFISQEFT
jgi:hypothetical protein